MANKNNKKKSNDLAVMGLVFSIFEGLPGIILSIMGLNQIKKTGEPGKGFAVAGIIIGIVNMLVVLGLIILFVILALSGEMDLNDSRLDSMTDYQKCNHIYTTCEKSEWYCEEYGCYCTYDDGEEWDYFHCDSYDFNLYD